MDMINMFHALGEELQIHEDSGGEGAGGDEGEGENDIVVSKGGRRGQPIDGVCCQKWGFLFIGLDVMWSTCFIRLVRDSRYMRRPAERAPNEMRAKGNTTSSYPSEGGVGSP